MPFPREPSDDAAIRELKDDRLERSRLVEQIATQLATQPGKRGMVVAVVGPWGSGKSSMLGLLEEQWSRLYGDSPGPVVIPFVPWRRVEDGDLVRDLMGRIAEELGEIPGDQAAKVGSTLLGYIAHGADAARRLAGHMGIPELAATLGSSTAGVASAARLVQKYLDSARSDSTALDLLRDQLLTVLPYVSRRIIVLIDEIDRLQPQDLMQLFRVVKGVASLPNTTYVLAYDEKAVSATLKSAGIAEPIDYLEKIVQLAIPLPAIEATFLDRMFFEELRSILGSEPRKDFRDDRLERLYLYGIRQLLRTVRDIRRLANRFAFAWGAVSGQVDPIDLLALVTLHVFVPDVYTALEAQPAANLAGRGSQGEPNASARFTAGLLDQVLPEQREPTKRIIELLFPKLGGNTTDEAYVPLGASNPNILPRYFLLGLAHGELDEARFRDFRRLAVEDRAKFNNRMLGLGPAAYVAFANQMASHSQTLSDADEAAAIVATLLSSAGSVSKKSQVVFNHPEDLDILTPAAIAKTAIDQIASSVGQRLGPDVRIYVLERAIEATTRGIGLALSLIDALSADASATNDSRTGDDARDLRFAATALASVALQEGRLHEDDFLIDTLLTLRDWRAQGIPGEASALFDECIRLAQDDTRVARCLLESMNTRRFHFLELERFDSAHDALAELVDTSWAERVLRCARPS